VGTLLASLLGAERSVLVVGPDDDLVKVLVDQGCSARQETTEPVDVIVLGQVLETSTHVEQTLRDALGSLSPGGQVLMVVPHAAHGSRRLALLQGLESYPAGHRRMFTADSLCDLASSVDLQVDALHATMRDPLDTEIAVDDLRLPTSVVTWVRHQPGALEHTYVAVARQRTDHEGDANRPEVVPTAPARTVRSEDTHLVRDREERDLRHRLLTQRDHILGLEASTAAAVSRAVTAQLRTQKAERRARRLRARLLEATTELDSLREALAAPRGFHRIVRRLRGRPQGPVR
jgi:hypothetical protein